MPVANVGMATAAVHPGISKLFQRLKIWKNPKNSLQKFRHAKSIQISPYVWRLGPHPMHDPWVGSTGHRFAIRPGACCHMGISLRNQRFLACKKFWEKKQCEIVNPIPLSYLTRLNSSILWSQIHPNPNMIKYVVSSCFIMFQPLNPPCFFLDPAVPSCRWGCSRDNCCPSGYYWPGASETKITFRTEKCPQG